MTETGPEPVAIAETRLLHKMHRAATSLLADAAHRRDSPTGALVQLRDFLVAALRHHQTLDSLGATDLNGVTA